MTKGETEPYKYSKTNFQDEIESWGVMNLNDKSVKIAGKTYTSGMAAQQILNQHMIKSKPNLTTLLCSISTAIIDKACSFDCVKTKVSEYLFQKFCARLLCMSFCQVSVHVQRY